MSLGIISLCEHFKEVNKLEIYYKRNFTKKFFSFNYKIIKTIIMLIFKKSTYELPTSVLKGFREFI